MNIQFYKDFIPYSTIQLDNIIESLEQELFVLNEKKKDGGGFISIGRKDGKLQVRGKLVKTLKILKRLLSTLLLKKKKLKQQGKDTTNVDKKIQTIRKKLK